MPPNAAMSGDARVPLILHKMIVARRPRFVSLVFLYSQRLSAQPTIGVDRRACLQPTTRRKPAGSGRQLQDWRDDSTGRVIRTARWLAASGAYGCGLPQLTSSRRRCTLKSTRLSIRTLRIANWDADGVIGCESFAAKAFFTDPIRPVSNESPSIYPTGGDRGGRGGPGGRAAGDGAGPRR